MRREDRQAGFGIIEILIFIVVIAALVGTGYLLLRRYQEAKAKGGSQAGSSRAVQNPTTTIAKPDSYAGWQTFTDNASVPPSGISIKYPSDWQVNTAGTKTYGWSISQAGTMTNTIAVNDIFQDGSLTARQEWQACEGTDACPGSSDERILSGSESTINGLNAYTATIQTSHGTYHLTVVRGDKTTANGVPYVMFMTYATDQAALSIFDKITASSTFPN